jgi:Uma2 family endonuclease
MTFDRGDLELMNPRRQHEELGCFMGRLVEAFTEVRDIDIRSVASTTFRRSDLSRAFEADESYYIANVDAIRRQPEVDLSVDPPPDLVIEVEITKSAIAKMPLFAAMGIPEVWRHDGQRLQMLCLEDNDYVKTEESRQLPGLTARMIDRVLERRYEIGETRLIRGFRDSLQDDSR